MIEGHHLLVYATDGSSAEPGPGATPWKKLEVVGAHLAAQRKQEVALSVPRAGHFTLVAPSPEERMEWMVGLGKVPGLFRWAKGDKFATPV